MKKLFIVMFLILVSVNANAEQWIECINTTIGIVSYEQPTRKQGDCLILGLCSGANNTGLATNVFEAVGSEWNDATQANKKCDRLASPGFRIISLTAQEITDINNALASQIDSALRNGSKEQFNGQTVDGQSLRCLVNSLIDELNILRSWTVSFKAETALASNLTDFKTRVATLSTLNNRTLLQAKTAIQGCIDSGITDE